MTSSEINSIAEKLKWCDAIADSIKEIIVYKGNYNILAEKTCRSKLKKTRHSIIVYLFKKKWLEVWN